MGITQVTGDGVVIKTINGQSLTGTGNLSVITDISGKQDTLVSGTNIKTIGGASLLGSGNILLGGIAQVTTATGNTTLTSTPTLLKITPAASGVVVTLPDATTCNVGGPLYIVDNRGIYPLIIINSSSSASWQIADRTVTIISLASNASAGGTGR